MQIAEIILYTICMKVFKHAISHKMFGQFIHKKFGKFTHKKFVHYVCKNYRFKN